MKEILSSKQRLLTAIRNGKADRVPVCPDISNMIPCRLMGMPYWEIYANKNPPLWEAWLSALDYYGFDGYFNGCEIDLRTDTHSEDVVLGRTWEQGRLREKHVIRTPAGDLDYEWTYHESDSPAMTVKPIKDLARDFSKVRYLFPRLLGYSREPLATQEKRLGDRGVTAIYVSTPGFGNWIAKYFDGGAEQVAYAWYDRPDLLDELRSMNDEYATRHLEFVLDAKPDCMEVGVAGGISLASPDAFRRFSLPTIQKHTRMAKMAGIPSVLHCCGKERDVVAMCAETDLNCINPLEPPPQGDCDLAELKVRYGNTLSLMGNLHTTSVMFFGTSAEVEQAARSAIRAAGKNGGFILSTGDQCGRDTPDANIFKMIEVARNEGRYV